MAKVTNAEEARHEFIDVLRSLHPDKVMSERLDKIEKALGQEPTKASAR